MSTWILTAISRSGQPVNPVTKAPTDRLAAAKTDPRDLHVTVRKIA